MLLRVVDSGRPFDPPAAEVPEAPQELASARAGGPGIAMVRKATSARRCERRDARYVLEADVLLVSG